MRDLATADVEADPNSVENADSPVVERSNYYQNLAALDNPHGCWPSHPLPVLSHQSHLHFETLLVRRSLVHLHELELELELENSLEVVRLHHIGLWFQGLWIAT